MNIVNDKIQIRSNIDEQIGQKVRVRGCLGRCKYFEKDAIIQQTYPNHFTIKYLEQNNTDSYSYTDIITKNVQLNIYGADEDTVIPLF